MAATRVVYLVQRSQPPSSFFSMSLSLSRHTCLGGRDTFDDVYKFVFGGQFSLLIVYHNLERDRAFERDF